jgi:hypothetical protein
VRGAPQPGQVGLREAAQRSPAHLRRAQLQQRQGPGQEQRTPLAKQQQARGLGQGRLSEPELVLQRSAPAQALQLALGAQLSLEWSARGQPPQPWVQTTLWRAQTAPS